MGVRTIRSLGDRVLRQKARPVTDFGPSLASLMADMAETMYHFVGIGLAANQIGILRRIIVFDVGSGLQAIINPELVEGTGERLATEGCLSVPGRRLWVRRYERVVVQGVDLQAQRVEIAATDLLARCLQHEIDHLDGILIVDRKWSEQVPKEVSYGT